MNSKLRVSGLIANKFIIFLLVIFSLPVFSSGSVSGEVVFKSHCASCHGSDPRAPVLAVLETMTPRVINDALTSGKMRSQGEHLSATEKTTLIAWLSRKSKATIDWEVASLCKDTRVNVDGINYTANWGLDANNSRRQKHTQLTNKNVAQLKQKWVIAFPGATVMRSQPAIMGDTLFLAVASMYKVYALDKNTGCLKWSYSATKQPRSAVLSGHLKDGTAVVFYGDIGGYVHMLNAITGKPIWVKNLALSKYNIITGPLTLYDNKLFVPHSTTESLSTIDPNYECCKAQGALTAHNASTGETIWIGRTMIKPTYKGKSRVGTRQYGPAGASIWNAPLIDKKRGLIIVGTGPISSGPALGSGDAIIAFDMETGKQRWKYQATKNDLWNSACRSFSDGKMHPNCPASGWDFDFGAGVILGKTSQGKDILIAGQKSGQIYGINPDSGKLIWKQRISDGSILGGIHWGMTTQGNYVYVPINDPVLKSKDVAMTPTMTKFFSTYQPRPGLYKLSIDTGEVIWEKAVTYPCKPDYDKDPLWPTCPKEIGLSAAILSVEGAIITGGLDGRVKIYDAKSGDILFKTATSIAYNKTVNHVTGHGGSIDNASMMVAEKMLYVQSGYGFLTGMPGNVLIAFSIE